MQSDLVTDIGWASCHKYGEELCGDQVVIHDRHGTSPVLVLADGLGSGVKACILATLTAKIIATMIANAMPLEECVATVASTLPVCEIRKIAYATFTIIRITDSREAEVIEFENPGLIVLRNGKSIQFPATSTKMSGKTILTSKFALEEGDILVAVSDGTLHASVGETLNYAWDRSAIIQYLEDTHAANLPAKSLCTVLRDQCRKLYGYKPGDDVSVCAVAVRRRSLANVLIGPPKNPVDDAAMLEQFLPRPGTRIVCGGTTAQIVAKGLNAHIREVAYRPDPAIPPISTIAGIDLVTEGALTVSRVAAYAEEYSGANEGYDDWCFSEDGASRMAQLLLDKATDISFTLGLAENPAHCDLDTSSGLAAKPRMVKRLASALKKSGKNVSFSYW